MHSHIIRKDLSHLLELECFKLCIWAYHVVLLPIYGYIYSEVINLCETAKIWSFKKDLFNLLWYIQQCSDLVFGKGKFTQNYCFRTEIKLFWIIRYYYKIYYLMVFILFFLFLLQMQTFNIYIHACYMYVGICSNECYD